MNRLTFATTLALPLALWSGAALAECGALTIASMNWQSAEVLASLDQFILNEGYGCDAQVIIADTVPAITSLVEKGEPEIIPEGWVGLMPELFRKGMDEGSIVAVGKSLSDGGVQGWFMPKFVQDRYPEIRTVADVLEHPELFPGTGEESVGAIHTGPQGWGGTVITSQLAKGFKAEEHGFELVDTGSAAGHDGSIARAYERGEGWIGYYWAPTSLLGKYQMVKVDFGVPLDQMTGEIRRKAKAINFGIIYGISGFGLGRQLGISAGEANAFIKTYLERFSELAAYMDRTKEFCRRNGYVTTLFGRRCHIQGIAEKNPARRQFAERQAINAPIQGTAADIIKRAMIRIPPALADAGLQGRMLLQVHDELVLEVPEAEAAETADLVRQTMEAAASLSVPLVAEAGTGHSWAEAH